MRPLKQTIEDQRRDVITYEFDNGQRVTLSGSAVRKHGVYSVLRASGIDVPKERLPVYQGRRKLGTMAPDFDPLHIRSNSFFYDPRPGDFRREGNCWMAADSLGPGDIEAVVGFVRECDSGRPPEGEDPERG